MKNLYCLLAAFVFLHFLPASAQDPSLKFEHVDINSGLSQNHVMRILQDSRGFMWFGTRDGLNMYDGYHIRVYKNEAHDTASISNNFISGMVEDSKGILWVATRGGGLNRYDRASGRFERFRSQPRNPATLTSDLLVNISIDHNDNLWICSENGLNFFDTHTRRVKRMLHDPANPKSIVDDNAYCVYEDAEKHIWVGSNSGGLNLYHPEDGSFTNYRHDDKNSHSLSHNNVRVIFEDSKQRLWVGTVGGGLNLFQRETQTFRQFRHVEGSSNSLASNIVYSVGEDNEGRIWVGSENAGLSLLNLATETFQTYRQDDADNKSLSNNSVYHIYRDLDGNMWLGTFAGGVNLYKRTQSRFAHFNHTSDPNSLSNNNVMSLAEDQKGNIWMGTDGGGLNVFDPVNNSFQHYRHSRTSSNSLCGDYVLSVCRDDRGRIWAGTWGDGLSVFDPATKRFRNFKNRPGDATTLSSNNAWTVYQDHLGTIWIACYGGGLNRYEPATESFTHFGDTINNISKQVSSIAEDEKGNLYVGTDGDGLHVFDRASMKYKRFIHQDGKNSISDDRINYIYRDTKGNFWICTMDGLNYFDVKTQTFKVYSTTDGLPNSLIYAIVSDASGNYWVSTGHGISRFDGKTHQFKTYTLSDGVQSYEFKAHSVCAAHTGALYFGGINGFNVFYPDQIREDHFNPPLVLTRFQIFSHDVPVAISPSDPSPLKKHISETREITLSYDQSVISFEFASLNFSSPEKRQYSYMLTGFDKGWNTAGEHRTATYTNLDPGHYVFHVRGSDAEGKWSNKEIQLKINITPPFWMTGWFRFLVVLALVGGIYAIYKFRMRSIRQQQQLLQAKVQQQTRQLRLSAEQEHKARMDAEKANQHSEEANKELERKNKELEQFAYVASHDLQEPLRTTSAFAQMLQMQYQGKLDERADKYLSFMIESTERMKVLIHDLLDYSRIGRKLDLTHIDCNELLDVVTRDMNATIHETQAEITTDPLPVLNGYSTELKQLFQNLLTNAIKFRRKDMRPHIHVAAKRCSEHWHFSIKDNGIGIDPKHSERIFVIFQRLHTRTEYPGSGIGLSNCKKIVELHKGNIWVESQPGEGSTFHFTISAN